MRFKQQLESCHYSVYSTPQNNYIEIGFVSSIQHCNFLWHVSRILVRNQSVAIKTTIRNIQNLCISTILRKKYVIDKSSRECFGKHIVSLNIYRLRPFINKTAGRCVCVVFYSKWNALFVVQNNVLLLDVFLLNFLNIILRQNLKRGRFIALFKVSQLLSSKYDTSLSLFICYVINARRKINGMW